jgi:hypothetical protein
MLWVLAASKLVVPTPDEAYDGTLAHFVPLLVGRDGVTFMVVFTAPEMIGRYDERAPQFIELLGLNLVHMIPPGVGLAVNPETPFGFDVPSEGLAALRDELRAPDSP